MRIHASAIYSILFAAFAEEDRVHAKSIAAWDNNNTAHHQEKLTASSSTKNILRSKVIRSAISTRHLVAIDPTQIYKYKKLGNDLEGDDESKFFGSAVAMNGDGSLVAVGSEGDYGYTGSVFVFQYNPSTLQWAPFGQRIRGENAGDNFGASLAMSNDGLRLAVGAPSNYGYRGHMRVYQYTSDSAGGEWSIMGSDLDGDAAGDNAGTSVTISGDGSRVAMGAPLSASTTQDQDESYPSTAGRVLIFSYNETAKNWVVSGNVIESPVTAYLGGAVSLSENGNRVVVGGRMFTPIVGDKALDYAGGVSVYDFVDSVWVQAGDTINGLDYYDRFGHDVDISDDGTRIVVGAFTSDGQDLNRRDIGQATVFQEDTSIPAGWRQIGPIINGEQLSDKLGSSVTISGDGNVAAVGAPDNDDGGTSAGEVEMYQYIQAEDEWQQIGVDIGADSKSGFGGDVVVSGDGQRIIVGAKKGNYYAGFSGVYEIIIAAPTPSPSPPPSAFPTVTKAISTTTTNIGIGNTCEYHASMETVVTAALNEIFPSATTTLLGYTEKCASPFVRAAGDSVDLILEITITSESADSSTLPSNEEIISDIDQNSASIATNISDETGIDVTVTDVTLIENPSASPSISPTPTLSQKPTLSNKPSQVPSSSESPSSGYDRVFQIKSLYSEFDSSKQWCLTAEMKNYESKLRVRPCESYTSLSNNLQLFTTDVFGQLKLAGSQDGFCLASASRTIQLEGCDTVIIENKQFAVDTLLENTQSAADTAGDKLSQTKNGQIYYVGFESDKRFSRIRLYKKGSFNKSLDKWSVVYGSPALLVLK